MWDLKIMKNKEKVGEKNSKNEGEIIPNRKIRNCHDCDANRKWILPSQAKQTKILRITLLKPIVTKDLVN